MPYLGIGLHVLIAIYFAVHAVRTGQPYYWLFILFSFPLLGSIVYLLVVYLPATGIDRGARRALTVAGRVLDPGRELREARQAHEDTPTAANQMRLANALLEAGEPAEAATHFEQSLRGVFANDPDIRFGAARARFTAGEWGEALQHLDTLQQAAPDFRAEAVAILRARALAALGRVAESKEAFGSLLDRFGSFEVKAEYVIWAADAGESALLRPVLADLERSMARWPRHTRDLHRELIRRLEAARDRMS